MSDGNDVLAKLDVETEIERVDVKAVAVLNRSEVEAQLDAAHKYPRKLKTFVDNALSMATITEEVAQSCIYALPRDGKTIPGPSVRLAEICASAWGNLHYGGRVVDEEEKVVVAQGICWDLERNVRVTIESRRRITDKRGRRYNDDMVTMTGNAAASIALRNAIFRVIPRAFVDAIYGKVREVAVGNARTLESRRASIMANFAKLGVTAERVLEKIERASVEEMTLDDYEMLVGIGTALRNGDHRIEDFFPAPGSASQSADTKGLEARLRAVPPPPPGAAPAQPPPALADHAKDAEALKQEIVDALASKDKKRMAGLRKRFEEAEKTWPAPLLEEVLKFHAAVASGKDPRAPEPKGEYLPPGKRGDSYDGPDEPPPADGGVR